MFFVEFLEGKAYTHQAGPLEFEDLDRKTVVLLLLIMKSYFSTFRYVMIDYGFCVLKGLIQFRNKIIFACAVTKKRRYWTSIVPGKETDDHFGDVGVEDTDAIQGTVDDFISNLWVMKEYNYVIIMMATCGRLLADDT